MEKIADDDWVLIQDDVKTPFEKCKHQYVNLSVSCEPYITTYKADKPHITTKTIETSYVKATPATPYCYGE